MNENRQKKGFPIWIGLGCLASLIGFAAFIGLIWFAIQSSAQSIAVLKVPGSVNVKLEKAGEYTIFQEYSADWDDNEFDSDGRLLIPKPSHITVMSVSSANEIPLEKPKVNYRYTIMNKKAGTLIRKFKVTEPGEYEVSAELESGAKEGKTFISIKEGQGKNVIYIIGAVAAMMFAMLAFFATIIFGVIKLLNRKSEKVGGGYDVNSSGREAGGSNYEGDDDYKVDFK